jgi:hypothetical protein
MSQYTPNKPQNEWPSISSQPPSTYPPQSPPPQQWQPPQKPPKKKRGPLFWILIIAGVVLVLGIFGSLVNSTSQTSTSTTTTQSAQPPATQAPTQKPTPQIVLHKQDEVVKTGGYTVSIEFISTYGVPKYSDLKPGQYAEAVSVDVTVPSDGSSTWVSRLMVNLTDIQGHAIDRVNTLKPMSWTPKPGVTTAILNQFILTHGGNYILSFKGLSGETVYWSVTMQ